jgi:hypothetical protein
VNLRRDESGCTDTSDPEDHKIPFRRLVDRRQRFAANVANGVIDEVTSNKKESEKITGGDLGLLLIRSQIKYDFNCLRISDYHRALLAQAKLKRSNGKWNVFKPNQKKDFAREIRTV